MPGYLYKITCPYCQQKFEWKEGTLQGKIILHCNTCGKELLHTKKDGPLCECGGWFEKYEYWMPLICTHCQKEIEQREIRKYASIEQW